jgi:hypothetical protein
MVFRKSVNSIDFQVSSSLPTGYPQETSTKAIIDYFNISIELVKEIAESIVSIGVHGKESVNTWFSLRL